MPYTQEFVPAAILVDLGDLMIYYTYKNFDINDPMAYWYTTEEDSEEKSFDIRELPNYDPQEESRSNAIVLEDFPELGMEEPEDAERYYHAKLIRELHQAGTLKQYI